MWTYRLSCGPTSDWSWWSWSWSTSWLQLLMVYEAPAKQVQAHICHKFSFSRPGFPSLYSTTRNCEYSHSYLVCDVTLVICVRSVDDLIKGPLAGVPWGCWHETIILFSDFYLPNSTCRTLLTPASAYFCRPVLEGDKWTSVWTSLYLSIT
jgi:hypothetical protein